MTLHIEQGECFGLLGTNGAGKSTIISMLTGLLTPTAGSALIAGHDVLTEMNHVQQRAGVCPHFDILWRDSTVLQTLFFYYRLKEVVLKDEVATATEAAELVRLRGKDIHKTIKTLYSSGMIRRVSFAISLVGGLEVVFLDEPTPGLDPHVHLDVRKCILKATIGRGTHEI